MRSTIAAGTLGSLWWGVEPLAPYHFVPEALDSPPLFLGDLVVIPDTSDPFCIPIKLCRDDDI